MLYVLQGDDEESIYQYIKKNKTSFNPSNIYEYEGFQKNLQLIKNVFYSENIFGGQNLIVIKVNSSDDLGAILNMNAFISDHQMILHGTLNKKYSATKTILKNSKIINFGLKAVKHNFLLCEAIFLERDKKKSIRMINNYINIEESIFTLISLMQTYIRNLLSKEYRNNTWDGLSPYFKKKFEEANNTFSECELIALYDNLRKLDESIKRGSTKKIHQLMLDFVIYSI